MKKTKRPLNTWAFLGIYLAILAVFAGVYALTKAINKPGHRQLYPRHLYRRRRGQKR